MEQLPKITDADLRRLYGYAEIDPSGPVTAGATGTWRITYRAGFYGVDDGGVIKVVWRFVSDWGAPQFRDPKAAEYATVSTTGPASLRPAFEMRRYVRPWNRCVTVDVFDESLSEGDAALPADCHPCWVRVLQTDGAKAWASPIYVVTRDR